MLPTCKQATEQLSENIDHNIRGFKLFKLKLHLMMCRLCRRYDKQINLSAQTINLVEPSIKPSDSLKAKVLHDYRGIHQDSQNKHK